MTTTTIIAGSDGSEESARAVEWAAAEAARRSAALRIISVADPPSERAGGHNSAATLAELMHSVYGQALRSVAERAAAVSPGLPVRTDLLEGQAGPILAAESSGAAMLVVGPYGVGGYQQPGTGPQCRHLTEHARCPVVVVRDQDGRPHQEVAAGVRDLYEATEALGFAFEEARIRKARLVVIHAWSSPTWAQRQALGTPQDAAELARGLTEWQRKYPDVPVTRTGVPGHPGKALAEFSALVDLTVIGRHDHHDHRAGVRPAASVVSTALNLAQGPVAVIPSS